jgi:hypothetical protein
MQNINILNAIKNNISNSMTSGIYAISRMAASGINISNHSDCVKDAIVDGNREEGIVCGRYVCGSDKNPNFEHCK